MGPGGNVGAANLITKDPNYADTLAKRCQASARRWLHLPRRWAAPAASVSAGNQTLFTGCTSSVRLATRRVASVLLNDPSVSADVTDSGFLAALVKGKGASAAEGGRGVPQQLSSCVERRERHRRGGQSQPISRRPEAAYGEDRPRRCKSINRLGADLSGSGVFDTIIHNLNVWSVSPVFAFDTARIWPEVIERQRLATGGWRRTIDPGESRQPDVRVCEEPAPRPQGRQRALFSQSRLPSFSG